MDAPLTPKQVFMQQGPGSGRIGLRTIMAEYWRWGGQRIKSRTGDRYYYRFPPDAWERFWNYSDKKEPEPGDSQRMLSRSEIQSFLRQPPTHRRKSYSSGRKPSKPSKEEDPYGLGC